MSQKLQRNPYVSLDCGQFLTQVLPPQECILEPWLPKQGLAMVYAERGIGKTFFALEVALTVASGGQFLNWGATDAYRVLYLDGEMQANQLQERIRQLSYRHSNQVNENFRLMPCGVQDGAMPDLCSPEAQRLLTPHLDGVDLVIVDNISTLCRQGAENEAESWRPVQEWLLRLRADGKSVLLVHHAGKGGQQRGTSKREDILDTVINLKRPDDYHASEGARFEVTFEKARGFAGEDAQNQVISLNEISDGFEWTSEKAIEGTFDQVVQLVNQGIDQSSIATKLQKSKSTISRHVSQARQRGLLVEHRPIDLIS